MNYPRLRNARKRAKGIAFGDTGVISSPPSRSQMVEKLDSGFGGWVNEKIKTVREAVPSLGRKISHPQHLTLSHEEVLTFSLEIQPGTDNYVTCKKVMVDRGEYAACGISELIDDAEEFDAEMQSSSVEWWEVGYEEFADDIGDTGTYPDRPMKEFIVDVGEDADNDLEADFLYITCHGMAKSPNGWLLDNDDPEPNVIMEGWPPPPEIDVTADWNEDVDWVWIDACRVLDHDPPGALPRPWAYAMAGSPRSVHMILSYHGGVTYDGTGIIDDFFDNATGGSPMTIVDSFYHANTDWSRDEPCAILEHVDNDGDYLKNPSRDTGSASLRYYWYDTAENEWNWEAACYSEQSNGTIVGSAAENVELMCQLPGGTFGGIAPIEMELVSIRKRPQGFRHSKRLHGAETFSMAIPRESVDAQEIEDAREKADGIIEQIYVENALDGLSEPQVSTLYVSDFDADARKEVSEGIPLLRDIRYNHYYKGLPVVGDLLSVAVAGGRIVKIRTCWHKVLRERSDLKETIVTSESAFHSAAGALDRMTHRGATGDVRLLNADLCYYGFHDADKQKKTFIPVWAFRFDDKRRRYKFYVDAHTNKLIDSSADAKTAGRKVSGELPVE